MNANDWIRQFHRWISIIFTLTVIANFVAMALRKGLPPPWITYAPLLPLALLLFTGLYLFARPYFSRDRTRRRPVPRAASGPPAHDSGSSASN